MRAEDLRNTLRELALDLRWSWNHVADELWSKLDPELWEQTRNAWVVLQTISQERLDWASGDPGFEQRLEDVLRDRRERAEARRWFRNSWPDGGPAAVAYFSLEYMLSDALPIYSGGLGNVAGDQLKAASDLGVPVIGLGILYQQGYFRQHIDEEGHQQAFYPFNDPGQLPIAPVRESNGEWLRIPIAAPGSTLWIRTWQVQVGQTKLYLLDTNDPANLPEYRGITSDLYGGGPELRIQQERVLGIGGWRLLRALGLKPEVCHLNEGHAAFAVLERARDYMEQTGQSFAEALAVTRPGNLFTTHTPVASGFDQFPAALMRQQLREYAETELRIPFAELLMLGRSDPKDESEPFNMAYLAIRGSGAINAVSQLHEHVSRRIFQPLFPHWPEVEVPVGHVTNGVHTPTWDSAAADDLWTNACGKDRWLHSLESLEERLRRVPASELWQVRTRERRVLIDYVRQRLARQLATHGALSSEVEFARQIFDPATLTIGFARRFATYKRPNLLLRNPDRLLRILTGRSRPVQLVLAGKAHPQDQAGQEMIRQWIDFIRNTPARSHAIFLADYDMQMSLRLVQGVDLWLNTPRRPWEASGTSGMKVLVNGGLNLSELDGWWAEAYSPDLGWAIGDGKEHGDDSAWDDIEAGQLYDLLEQQVIPAYYNRDESGIPTGWVNYMRESMARLTPGFSANRAVREYTERHYIPAAKAYDGRTKDGGRIGADVVKWRTQIEDRWPRLRFGALSIDSNSEGHRFTVQVYLDELNPDAVSVELFADAAAAEAPFRQGMQRGLALAGSEGGYAYTASVGSRRPAGDFTPRIIPSHPSAAVPLECPHILWYR